MKSVVALTGLLTTVAAFCPQQSTPSSSSLVLKATETKWDPMGFSTMGDPETRGFDTFPNMFPHPDYLSESEIKHGRMCMLAWTGVWATHVGGMGLGMHIPGMPVEPDWTKALGVVSAERPEIFGTILLGIIIAEGESVGYSGDNFRGMGTKTPGDNGLDPFGLKSKLSEEEQARYKNVELKNGRAAMIAMASLFAYESIPGSVPLMDLFN